MAKKTKKARIRVPKNEVGKPDFVEEHHLVYLGELCESGVTMFEAAPYLVETFGVDKKLAKKILAYWMETFTERRDVWS